MMRPEGKSILFLVRGHIMPVLCLWRAVQSFCCEKIHDCWVMENNLEMTLFKLFDQQDFLIFQLILCESSQVWMAD